MARGEVERWADSSLPVRDDLVLWIDAGRQAAAQAAAGLPASGKGVPVGIVFDGSGKGRHLQQRRGESQPRLVGPPGRAVLRFDGKDDCLERTDLGLSLDGLSIFLVAAPRSNLGAFRGLLSANQAGVNDYRSGFTIDLGAAGGSRFDRLSVEGKGFAGEENVLKSPRGFGAFHVLEVVIPPGPGTITTELDGAPQGCRPRQAGTLRIDELTLGARCYSNESRPVYVQGFLDGDVAEVLVYGRALGEAERRAVSGYLAAKHRGLSESIEKETAGDGSHALRSLADPPPFQVLLPGFTVRELPIKLANINNLRYRADGKLVAMGYNGNVYLLSDRDGDGLEDHTDVFWENQGRLRGPIGMALTPPGYPRGNGVFVASKGKVSLIVDVDGDERADREIVVAEGWKEIPQAVDALGVAVASDGSLYFGLGTADYTNAYLKDAQGKAHYDLKSERGTIVRVSPDFRSREIVATGIRFPVGLAFNREGDLFATDQEGATWLPNGNPFDELLHIRRGRHYGFPPRHSRFLPGVIDEPSTFDYAPQHQSTCGLLFNEPVGGRVFGPAWWAGNAIVCGYSRGKLFRTELAKVRGEYVARSSLFAVAGMLLVDACVSPSGALIVAAHSGAPDWGSGPDGPGKLYRIDYDYRKTPQPVLAWPSGPRESRIAFDRPIEPALLADLARGTRLEAGAAVAAGDRFESLRPGYAVVAAQLALPRRDVRVHGVSVTPDRRTLILATEPQAEAVSYAITHPGLGRPARRSSGDRALPQVPEIDLAYSPTGLAAEWTSADGTGSWSGWLPHIDLTVARTMTAGSPEHDVLWPRLKQPGKLVLRAQLRLADLLRPALQPGSAVDDRLPPEQAVVVLRSSRDLQMSSPAGTMESSPSAGRRGEITLSLTAQADRFLPVEVRLTTGPGADLDVDYHTNEDARPRALPLSRILVPWARMTGESASPTLRGLPPALAGGDYRRGRALFRSAEALCSKCHTVHGEGGKIGPDLSNLAERDVDSVLRDITTPSAAIHPDYLNYSLALKDGRVLNGPIRTEGDRLRVGNEKGEETVIARADVEELKPQAVSVMPEGLAKALGPEKLKDLLAFLMTAPPAPAPIHRDDAPPPRPGVEVEAVLRAGASTEASAPLRSLRIRLLGGPKDHGIDEHDYPLWLDRWSALLRTADEVAVTAGRDWPAAEDLVKTDVLVLNSAGLACSREQLDDLDRFLARGGGLVVIHYALNGNQAPDELAKRIGLAWVGGRSKFRHGPLRLEFTSGTDPITAGMNTLSLVDESYWDLAGDPGSIHVLAVGREEGAARPLVWTKEAGKGRVFCCVPGHYTWTFDDPLYRVLLLRGICWTARQPVELLSALATVGARVEGAAK
jgi:putative heme-binding domain-containing protein